MRRGARGVGRGVEHALAGPNLCSLSAAATAVSVEGCAARKGWQMHERGRHRNLSSPGQRQVEGMCPANAGRGLGKPRALHGLHGGPVQRRVTRA